MERLPESICCQLESYVSCIKESYNAAGIAVSVVDKDCNTLYENFWGYRDIENKLPINEDTIFGIASLTKSFTCLSMMQLEKKGVLSVDEPVEKYLPEFKYNGNDAIKIQHFMSHCAGYYPLSRIRIADVAKKLHADENQCDYAYNVTIAEEGAKTVIVRMNSQEKYVGKPGELSSYCNDGYGVLAELIRRYGKENTYAEYVEKHILKPLGMMRSTFEFNKMKTDKNVSELYCNENGELKSVNDVYNNHFVLLGGGGLKSTIGDMKKYIAMYLNKGKGINGTRIIDTYRVKEMCKPRILFRPQTYYGYGLYTEMLDNIATVRHYGTNPGVSSTMIWSDDLGIGAVVLCNTTGVPVENIGKAIMRAFNKKSPEVSIDYYEDIKPDEDMISDLIGRYEAQEGQPISIYRENNMLKVYIGDKSYDLHIVQKHLGIIYKPYQFNTIMILENEDGKIFAIKYNDRIIPKIS